MFKYMVYFILQMRKAESTSALDDIKKAEEQERQVTLEAGIIMTQRAPIKNC